MEAITIPLLLRSTTGNTYPTSEVVYSQIVTGEWMPAQTVSLASVAGGHSSACKDVDAVSSEAQMAWIDALSVDTDVIHDEFIWDWTDDEHHVRNTMRQLWVPSIGAGWHRHLSITRVDVARRNPVPASGHIVDDELFKETVEPRLRCRHGWKTTIDKLELSII